MTQMDYLALPVESEEILTKGADAPVDTAWGGIQELLFDDDAKAFAESAKGAGIPVPNEDNIGYEVTGDDGEVVATIEIAWPEEKIGFMTAEQSEDREKMESIGWRILDLITVTDASRYFGGEQ
jgi:putative helicase